MYSYILKKEIKKDYEKFCEKFKKNLNITRILIIIILGITLVLPFILGLYLFIVCYKMLIKYVILICDVLVFDLLPNNKLLHIMYKILRWWFNFFFKYFIIGYIIELKNILKYIQVEYILIYLTWGIQMLDVLIIWLKEKMTSLPKIIINKFKKWKTIFYVSKLYRILKEFRKYVKIIKFYFRYIIKYSLLQTKIFLIKSWYIIKYSFSFELFKLKLGYFLQSMYYRMYIKVFNKFK